MQNAEGRASNDACAVASGHLAMHATHFVAGRNRRVFEWKCQGEEDDDFLDNEACSLRRKAIFRGSLTNLNAFGVYNLANFVEPKNEVGVDDETIHHQTKLRRSKQGPKARRGLRGIDSRLLIEDFINKTIQIIFRGTPKKGPRGTPNCN